MEWSELIGNKRFHKTKVFDNSLTLADYIRLGRTDDVLLALGNGADPNAEDDQHKPVLCNAITLGNTVVVKRLLECGARIATTEPRGSMRKLVWWVKSVLVEALVRAAIITIAYVLLPDMLTLGQKILPIGNYVPVPFAGERLAVAQIFSTLCVATEFYVVLRLGTKKPLNGSMQRLCMAVILLLSFAIFRFLHTILFLVLIVGHTVIAWNTNQRELRPAPGTAALKTLFTYSGDGSEIMMHLLNHGIDLGNPRQEGSLYHEVWLWSVKRGYIDIARILLQRGVPPSLCVTDLDSSSLRQHGFNSQPLLLEAAGDFHEKMVELLLEYGSGGYTAEHLKMALLQCLRVHVNSADQDLACGRIVAMLLMHGADPNTTDSSGRSVLSYACGHMKSDGLATSLLAAGATATIASSDSTGSTALHYASCNHSTGSATAEILLDAGAPVNALDNKGHTPLWRVASWGQQPWAVSQLVSHNATVDLRGEGSTTPLMEACLHNDISHVQALLAHGADPNAHTMDDTPLLAAVRNKNHLVAPELVGVLLEAGARPVLPLDFPRQPLVESTQSHHNAWVIEILRIAAAEREVPKMILDNALRGLCLVLPPFESRNMNTHSSWNYSINLDAAHALIDEGADPTQELSRGRKFLHVISEAEEYHGKGIKEFIETLVKWGVSLNEQDDDGHTPLHLAARKANSPTVAALLQLDATPDILDHKSQTPLHTACQQTPSPWTRYTPMRHPDLDSNPQFEGKRGAAAKDLELAYRWRLTTESMAGEDIITYLLEFGANPLARDLQGLTPLHHACKAGNSVSAAVFLQYWPLRMLSQRKPRMQTKYLVSRLLSAVDMENMTPFHWAARSGNIQLVRMLLDVEVAPQLPPDDSDAEGRTEARRALDGTDILGDVVYGPSASLASAVNATDNAGYTPLHHAAREGHEEVVRVFIEEVMAADPFLETASGQTALDIAVTEGHTGVANILRTRDRLRSDAYGCQTL